MRSTGGKVGVNQIGGLINNLVRIGIQVAAVILGYGLAGLAGGFVAGLLLQGSSTSGSSTSPVPVPLVAHLQPLAFLLTFSARAATLSSRMPIPS